MLLWGSPWPQLLQEISPCCAVGPPKAAGGDLLQVGSVGLQGIHAASLESQPMHRETSTWAQALLHSAMEGPSPGIQ